MAFALPMSSVGYCAPLSALLARPTPTPYPPSMDTEQLLDALKEALTGRPEHPETDTHTPTDAEYRAYDEALNEWLEGLEAAVSSIVSQAEASEPDIDLGPRTERTLAVAIDPGFYSAIVILENGIWEQPTYSVPDGWCESRVLQAIARDTFRSDVLDVISLGPDPDCPEDSARTLPMQTEASEPDIDLGPWTERTLAVSTAHWPGSDTCADLTDLLGVDYKPHAYGGRVLLAFRDADDADDRLGKLPEPIAAILKEAHAQGFRWVDFDADADACPAFPSFDW